MATSTTEWLTIGRPGYAGRNKDAQDKRRDKAFGSGNWRIRHLWRREAVDRREALGLYEEAYFVFLQGNPEVLDWLCATASDVYDIAPGDVESGLDYFLQRSPAIHLQDVAIRRCLKRLGRAFKGDHLVQARGRNSEGFRLNPGEIPFHAPSEIIQPSLAHGRWWKSGSIEDFWQSNKVLQVKTPNVSEKTLREFVLKPLLPKDPQGLPRIAIFGGSFNPIHSGHIRTAHRLLQDFSFNRIIFAPNGDKYRKKGLIEEKHRAAMVEASIASESRFQLCRHELGRSRVVPSIETIVQISRELDQELGRHRLFLLRGADTIRRMSGWRSLPAILERASVVVASRQGCDPWASFGENERFLLLSDHFRFLPELQADSTSSTIIRKRAQKGLPLAGMVPKEAEDYICEHKLYC